MRRPSFVNNSEPRHRSYVTVTQQVQQCDPMGIDAPLGVGSGGWLVKRRRRFSPGRFTRQMRCSLLPGSSLPLQLSATRTHTMVRSRGRRGTIMRAPTRVAADTNQVRYGSTINWPFMRSCPNPHNLAHLKSYVPRSSATKFRTWSTPLATFPFSSGWSNNKPGFPLSLVPSA